MQMMIKLRPRPSRLSTVHVLSPSLLPSTHQLFCVARCWPVPTRLWEANMGGEDHDAANGAALEAEAKKKDSHSDHRDEFVASEGLTTQGEAPFDNRQD